MSVAAIMDAYVAPKSVFTRLKENKKASYLGLVLMIIVGVISQYLLFKDMSPEWIVEQQMQLMHEVDENKKIEAKAFIEENAPMAGPFAMGSVAIMTPVLILIYAFYFFLIGKLVAKNREITFGDWFSFSIWIAMPKIINFAGLIALVLMSQTPDLSMTAGNYASLNQLFLNLDIKDAWYPFAEGINLFTIWGIVLTFIGLKQLTTLSNVMNLIVAIAPTALFIGISTLIA
ncbi:hypothetical protein CS022_21845 [Veronia nyctiphanis]|uniref:Yip1 domain-containing protein n=1 Tax=Veronia nyctiphanis TaxID=1278244 RepID=A0A4Q0YP72_9GAMM|nr:YIP1 family protein [Veronia nyctiphanis]RXJ71049.1 hypothetical protein CS022_21845 [Veronia nyctiphanis]